MTRTYTKSQAEIDAGKWIRAARRLYQLPEEYEVPRDEPDLLRERLTSEIFWANGQQAPSSTPEEMFWYAIDLAAELLEFACYVARDERGNFNELLEALALETLDRVCGPESLLGHEPELDELRERVWPGYHERARAIHERAAVVNFDMDAPAAEDFVRPRPIEGES